MKRSRILFFYCLQVFTAFAVYFANPLCVNAQQPAEQKYAQTDSSRYLLSNPMQAERYEHAQEGYAVQLESLMPNKLSITQLQFTGVKGKFKPYQDAEKQTLGSFRAEGGKKLKNIWFWGKFIYEKQQLDSIRWGHRKDDEQSSPYFYAAQRAVHYTRTNYTINTQTGIKVWSPVYFALATDYAMGDHYSTNDPRAVLKHFKLKLQPSLNLKWSKLSFGVRGTWGYGQQESQVDYRNKEYYESTQFPEYLNWLSNGYGTIRPALAFSDRVYTNNQDYRGIGMEGRYQSKDLLLLGDIGYETIHEEYDRGNSSGRYDGYDMYGDYDLKQLKGQFSISHHGQGVLIRASQTKGRDLNVEFSGNNYVYLQQLIGLKVFKDIRLWDRNTSLWGSVENSYTNQADGNMMVSRKRGRQITTVAVRHTLSEQLNVEMRVGYSTPHSTEFTYNSKSTNPFIEEVIKSDVNYDKAQYLQSDIAVQYFFRLAEMKWCVQPQFGYIQRTNTVPDLTGKSRSRASASLFLYF
ncbi:DUF6850 family outer membrane beta-barrel protein [Sphingobacterium spiritivorum]|uniref:DUF6850 family outer membrane beta-barrel protein n=1 Tax=Sphingobacterium spiritivorum TaxID=258 RepID=UPI00191913EB|nr:DUF6850 family outer membrane beta-barrel protein [Sphingobacterium spiritivorum]QQT26016.1 hypothetical protein I6J02_20310 [Sphingobacterium spiritivorum]